MDAHKAGGAGEVRRINVVYFLSHGGRTDHPHLFRVNHLNRAGVRLRDVKRWLSELRGKDMPDSYSWSYKRKYKAGYVWQDLKEDDLITPISDNEYVLKGCDVRGTPPPCVQVPKRTHSIGEKKQEEVTKYKDDQNRPVEVVLRQDSDESSPKPPSPPPTDQDSPGGCESARLSATAAPFKPEIEKQQRVHEQKQKQQQEHDVVIKIEVPPSLQDHHCHQETQTQQQQEEEEAAAEEADAKAVARAAPAEQQPQGVGGVRPRHAVGQQARRMRVARALHNILTCGAADADDAALRPVARRHGRSAAEASPGDDWPPTPTCPGMDGCGLRVSRKPRARRGGKDKQGKRDGATRDAHKPATLPRCSQCGKEFKPQELHAHMQSCRGFKERMRSSSTGGARASADRRRNAATACGRSKRDHHYSPDRSSSASAVFLLTES
ncbi:hypothetical protein BS78_03G295500 [Paspalum vaginatum]|nr:hypothetical protein BS78_03G295500 [Paspalum vaginatum]